MRKGWNPGNTPKYNKEFSEDEMFRMNNSGFYEDVRATSIEVEPPVETPVVILDSDISINIAKYLADLGPDISTKTDAVRFRTTICHNKKDTLHVVDMIGQNLVDSLKTTFPDKDFSAVEENLSDLKNSLTMLISVDNKPNDLFIQYLLAMLSGILK